MPNENKKYDVFISYSTKDQKIAEGICAYLEERKYRCFVAYRDIRPTEVWAAAIANALDSCRMMVVVFSKNFDVSEQTDREIEIAAENKLPILTYRITDDKFTGAKKYYLKNINWIDAFPNPDKYFEELFKNIAKLLGDKPQPQPKLEPQPKPELEPTPKPEPKPIPQLKPEPEPQTKPELQPKSEPKPKPIFFDKILEFWKQNKLIIRLIIFGIIAIVAGIIIFNRVPNNVGGDTITTTATLTEEQEEQNNTVAEEYETFTINGVEFTMVYVEGGTFTMGATSEQGSEAYDDEKPTHQVTLSSYYIGETEVTQALWQAVMGNNPSKFKGDNLPVERVSYNDVQKFIKKLNQKTGKTFRLPTEADWEFAARGGKKSKGYKYSGSNNIEDVAWHNGNSNSKTHTVKTKQANELGLYDMSGNVWEWCSHRYGGYSSSSQTNPQGPNSGSGRVLRGGSWYYNARSCRVSNRNNHHPSISSSYNGFRLALAR